MSLFNSVRGNNNLCDCQNRTADVFEECDCRNRTTIIKDQVLVRDDELYKFKQNPNNHYPDDLRDKIEEVYCDCKEEHECCCGDENHVCLCGDENGVHECHCKCDDEVIDKISNLSCRWKYG